MSSAKREESVGTMLSVKADRSCEKALNSYGARLRISTERFFVYM
jgi:hypothetical protein